MTNLTPFGALFIILLIFAFGDFVGVVTKAKVSTMFVIMATFLVLFMTHAIPADICTTANLTYVTSIGLQFLLVDMGSSVGLTELKKEWRTVATATIAAFGSGWLRDCHSGYRPRGCSCQYAGHRRRRCRCQYHGNGG